MLGADAVKEIN